MYGHEPCRWEGQAELYFSGQLQPIWYDRPNWMHQYYPAYKKIIEGFFQKGSSQYGGVDNGNAKKKVGNVWEGVRVRIGKTKQI